MNQRDEPLRRSARIGGLLSSLGRLCGRVILPRDADVTQPAQVLHDPVEPRIRIRRLVETSHDGRNKLARQPDNTLVFCLYARSRLQHQARDIDAQSKRQYQRQQQVDPCAQG